MHRSAAISVNTHRGMRTNTQLIQTNMHLNAETPSLYFWRDRSGNEIDFLIEREVVLSPKEAKFGKTVASDWFDALNNWRAFAGNRAKPGMLLYGGDEKYSREGVTITSWRKAGQLNKA
jgi:hypothetical protein